MPRARAPGQHTHAWRTRATQKYPAARGGDYLLAFNAIASIVPFAPLNKEISKKKSHVIKVVSEILSDRNSIYR
jgi:hypothetical protein